jgi:hypothetical protein
MSAAVALDWKWIHENLIAPACKHPETTFQTYDTAYPDGTPAIGTRRVCLSCRKATSFTTRLAVLIGGTQ